MTSKLCRRKNAGLPCDSVDELVGHIRALRVRGAPLIGLSASLLLALLAERGLPQAELEQALQTLRASRPDCGEPDEQSGSYEAGFGTAGLGERDGRGSAAPW
ncbi:methylthioribose-1-phosphate isomerase [Serratia fonticola]|uniref:Methylthioribose-1-phosphate isomerase n=1 Tax=Serratia fonticola TaxID=47917 RepID=A0A4U9VKX9_SERFO|nr:methylthioribose-1-phosphate isomerase [Serratia fonticola]